MFKTDNNIPYLPLWTYFQIHNYVNNMYCKGNFSRPLTQLESVCLEGEQIQKSHLGLICLATESNQPSMDRFRESWSKDLQMTIIDRLWQRACIFSHKCSLSTRMQETAFEVFTQWYATPTKLHKWYPLTSDLFWHCQKDKGTLFHIWWQCPLISPYWTKVKGIIRHITETKLQLDAACCLLHITNLSFQKYIISLSKHLLNTDKALIPLFWKSTSTPFIRDWLHRITDIWKMEETIAQSNNTIEQYHKAWSPWFTFKYLQEFKRLKSDLPD